MYGERRRADRPARRRLGLGDVRLLHRATTSASRSSASPSGALLRHRQPVLPRGQRRARGQRRRLRDAARLRRELLFLRGDARRLRADRDRPRRRGRPGARPRAPRSGPADAPRGARGRRAARDRHRLRDHRDVRRSPPRSRRSGRRRAGFRPTVKFGFGAACWLVVLAYFAFQGRPRAGEGRRDPARPAPAHHVRGRRPRRAPGARRTRARCGRAARRSTRSCSLFAAACLSLRRRLGSAGADLAEALVRPLDPVRALARGVRRRDALRRRVGGASRSPLAADCPARSRSGASRRGARTSSRCCSSKVSAARRAASASRSSSARTAAPRSRCRARSRWSSRRWRSARSRSSAGSCPRTIGCSRCSRSLRSDSVWVTAISLLCYAAAVLVVEPFFVGAGFAMYLNRRVELEAWDIEQEFRLAFAR